MVQQPQIQVSAQKPVGQAAYRAAADVLTFKDSLTMIRQHIWLIVILAVTGFVVGGLSWFLFLTWDPQYTATAYIEVLSPVEKDPMRIGQEMTNKDVQYVFRTSLASLITQQGTLNDLLSRDKIKQTKWFAELGGSTKGGTTTGRSIENGLKELQKVLRASVDRDSDFIRVSMTCGDTKESALIANEMVDLFLKSRGNVEETNIRDKRKLLNDQRASVERDLSTYQTTLKNISITTGFSDLGEHSYQDVFTQSLSYLEQQSNSLMLDIGNTMAMIKTFERQATGPMEDQTSRYVEADPIVVMLNQQSILLESELASALTKYGENHRYIRQIQERLAEIKTKKQNRTTEIGEIIRQSNLGGGKDALDNMKEKLAQLQAAKKTAEEQKAAVDFAKAQYEETTTKRDEAQVRLAELKASIDKYDIALNSPDTPKVKIAAIAVEPLDVSFPRWEYFFPIGAILGLLFGSALAFAIEWLNNLVRTARDVAKFLRIPLLGIIPDAREDNQLGEIDPSLALIKAPYSLVGESYRNLRSNMKLHISSTSKSLLVTSPSAGEGKTSVAVNLAASLAAQGAKILIIDANFWKPKLSSLFPNPNHQLPSVNKQANGSEENGEAVEYVELGLSTVLAGLCGYHEVIRPTGATNCSSCDFVDSGILSPNPAALLGSQQMAQFIKHQTEKYDYVIIDGPPALIVGDVKLLARIVDGTILVFNASSTQRGTAERVISELRQVNANILGCVLFGVHSFKGGYFKEQFKAYQEYQKVQFPKPAVS